MTVSVLMPVYNTNPEHLKESIESVLNQTYQEFELVIVNNSSNSEKTLEVLEKYKSNPKVSVYDCEREEEKKNLSVALNLGISKTKYDLIARIDSDDNMLPERLEKQVKYMNENPNVSILGTQLVNMSSKKETSHPEDIHEFYYFENTHILNHPTVMFRKQDIVEVGGYPESPDKIPEDFILWTKALRAGKKIRNLSEVLVEYRDDAMGLSMIDSTNENWNKAIASVIYN